MPSSFDSTDRKNGLDRKNGFSTEKCKILQTAMDNNPSSTYEKSLTEDIHHTLTVKTPPETECPDSTSLLHKNPTASLINIPTSTADSIKDPNAEGKETLSSLRCLDTTVIQYASEKVPHRNPNHFGPTLQKTKPGYQLRSNETALMNGLKHENNVPCTGKEKNNNKLKSQNLRKITSQINKCLNPYIGIVNEIEAKQLKYHLSGKTSKDYEAIFPKLCTIRSSPKNIISQQTCKQFSDGASPKNRSQLDKRQSKGDCISNDAIGVESASEITNQDGGLGDGDGDFVVSESKNKSQLDETRSKGDYIKIDAIGVESANEVTNQDGALGYGDFVGSESRNRSQLDKRRSKGDNIKNDNTEAESGNEMTNQDHAHLFKIAMIPLVAADIWEKKCNYSHLMKAKQSCQDLFKSCWKVQDDDVFKSTASPVFF